MPTLEHRRAELYIQLLQNDLNLLLTNLANATEEVEKLKARVAELEPKPVETPTPPVPPS